MSHYGEPEFGVVYGNGTSVDELTLIYPSMNGGMRVWYRLDLRTADLPRLSWGLGHYPAEGVVVDTPRVMSLMTTLGIWTDVPAYIRRDMMSDYATLVGVSLHRPLA